jgi:transcriptional regulator with XRE-family HTH domain
MSRYRKSRTPELQRLANQFGAEFRRAKKARKMTNKQIAEAIGCSANFVTSYCKGYALPRLPRAAQLADLLMWPGILDKAKDYARRNCVFCGIEFYDYGQQLKAQYCSNACRATFNSRRSREADEVKERFGRYRLKVFQEKVAAYCQECTAGEAICRDEECQLREVSPYPFVALQNLDRKKSA